MEFDKAPRGPWGPAETGDHRATTSARRMWFLGWLGGGRQWQRLRPPARRPGRWGPEGGLGQADSTASPTL